ncbi:pseudouridylate synthase [Chytriomyces confervae]|uniref:Pseudouridylate synthase n=1 Tax=Chytriomyces confervae TaxID=246404 RepID=A0A507FSJ3_9FUNG|nr:pseudouridylate synthase [Chytriomyces confervae]
MLRLVAHTRPLNRGFITSNRIVYSKEVLEARKNGLPIVALESTIVTHGMPFPHNLDTALGVENIVRKNGAVPATIAVIGGKVHVGLEDNEIRKLADLTDKTVPKVKASRRDLGLVLARGWTGSTTVAATSIIANAVGISVFVTGGIGGVHRNGHITMDVSADLTELSRTPIAVVCAGIKSILDIPRTLEYLETMGVPVVSYQTTAFPAFYTPLSGYDSIAAMASPQDCASLIKAQRDLGLQNGTVIGVPIPRDAVEIDGEELEKCIQKALIEAEIQGISGKNVTPFLLDKVKEVTDGKSLNANMALIANNAHVGSQIAVSLAELIENEGGKGGHGVKLATFPPKWSPETKIAVIGATNLDIVSKFSASASKEKSAEGSVSFSLGGVGRNIAEACWRSGGDPYFVSAIGSDPAGDIVQAKLKDICMPMTGIEAIENATTGCYNGILDSSGNPLSGVADMKIHDLVGNSTSSDSRKELSWILKDKKPQYVVVDANISAQALKDVVNYSEDQGFNVTTVYEPTSVPKCTKIISLIKDSSNSPEIAWKRIKATFQVITPNVAEVAAMLQHARSLNLLPQEYEHEFPVPDQFTLISTDDGPVHAVMNGAIALSTLFRVVVVKLGRAGAFIVSREVPLPLCSQNAEMVTFPGGFSIVHVPSLHKEGVPVVSVTGAGDSLVGAMVSALARKGVVGKSLDGTALTEAVCEGMEAAAWSLRTWDAVSEHVGTKVEDGSNVY